MIYDINCLISIQTKIPTLISFYEISHGLLAFQIRLLSKRQLRYDRCIHWLSTFYAARNDPINKKVTIHYIF